MELKSVSVIIPVYNAEKFLDRCINSITKQTYKNIEIILIDDGSHDNSLSIAKHHAQFDSRIIVCSHENKGVSEARNLGISYANGDYILFVDSDDWIEPTLIEELMKYSNLYDLVMCSYNRCYKKASFPKRLDFSGVITANLLQRKLIGPIGNELTDPTILDSFGSIGVAKLFKREIIGKYQIRFESLKNIGSAEDVLFCIEYSEYIHTAYIINEPLYNYWKGNDVSITSTFRPELQKQWLNLFNHIAFCISKKKEQFKMALNNRICLSVLGLGLNYTSDNSGDRGEQIRNLKAILNDKIYITAFESFNLSKFPIHWKLFFLLCKKKLYIGMYILLKIMRIIISIKSRK